MEDEGELKRLVLELRQRVDNQARRIEELEASTATRRAPAGRNPQRAGRRDVLKLAGTGVVAALAAAAVREVPAAAANGDAIVIGNTAGVGAQVGTAQTRVNWTIDNATALVLNATPAVSTNFASALQASGTNSPAIRGDSDHTGVWGEGNTAINATGVRGSVAAVGYGVIGEAPTGVDFFAFGSGRIVQVPRAASSGHNFNPLPPAAGQELIREDDASIWASRSSGTGQAAWKRINTIRLDAGNGTGALFTPTRVVDTRVSIGGVAGPLAPGTTYTFGPYAAIPSSAIGIVGNLTVCAPGASLGADGWAAIFPGGTGFSGTSNVNFGGPTANWANAFTVALGTGLGAGKFSVLLGGSASNHLLVDIFGYIE